MNINDARKDGNATVLSRYFLCSFSNRDSRLATIIARTIAKNFQNGELNVWPAGKWQPPFPHFPLSLQINVKMHKIAPGDLRCVQSGNSWQCYMI